MSGNLPLDWAMMAVSLFNTIITLWLGLTVLLNAEKRTFGIWVAGGGLLLGSAFFLSHTAILGLEQMPYRANLWWRLGWIPVILAPFAWYVGMLWYSGYWETQDGEFHQRQRIWFWLFLFTNITLLMLFLIANPLPSLLEVMDFTVTTSLGFKEMPILILFYPFYYLSCIGLSLDALLRPGPTLRLMGELARHRARPWLISASICLLSVGLLIIIVLLWSMDIAHSFTFSSQILQIIAGFDLSIALLISVAILLTGQAIVSYEVFTGKSLPRRGFKRYWQLAIILAAGYSSSLSLSLMISLPLIYILLLSTGLMIVFYALLSWQSYVERERFTEQLRPFISSQQLYDRLVSGQEALVSSDIQQPFEALCKDFLDAQSAILVPFGSLATMFGPAVTYPPNNEFSLDQLEKIADSIRDPSVLCHALDPDDFENLFWAVPLWNVSGLSGVLLLGWKTDQAPYTQEEIEIARATGERLIDIQASAEIAQRLMALQREQMVESQVIDRRTRLILHDDILPHLHTIILDINSQEFGEKQNAMEIVNSLTNIHHQITDLLQVMPAIKRSDVGRLGLKAALEKLINLELKGAFDQVKWQINQEAEQKVRELPPLTTEILFYAIREAIRNAAQHARNPQDENPIQLIITFDSGVNLVVVVEDTGVGLDDSRQQERAGGKGLALHSTMLSVVGGSLSVESISGISTKVFITLPV